MYLRDPDVRLLRKKTVAAASLSQAKLDRHRQVQHMEPRRHGELLAIMQLIVLPALSCLCRLQMGEQLQQKLMTCSYRQRRRNFLFFCTLAIDSQLNGFRN